MAMMPEKVPCLMYSLVLIITQVQVNPQDQGAVYIERIMVSSMCSLPIALRSDYCHFVYVAVSNFVLPELEIVGCPVKYNPSLNEYEVNFQWKAPFSPAGLSFIRHFQMIVLQKMRGQDLPLSIVSSEYINVGDGSVW